MVDATLPAGIERCQYLQVIYPSVSSKNNCGMDENEHWRLRLIELKDSVGGTQAAMAAAIEVDPSYLSRLFYPAGKKGRKNLGLDTLRALIKAYNLSADWFDLPLGSKLPGQAQAAPKATEAYFGIIAREPAGRQAITGVKWPFKEASYARFMQLLSELGPKTASEAIRDIDSLLDAAISKWERRAGQLGKQAS